MTEVLTTGVQSRRSYVCRPHAGPGDPMLNTSFIVRATLLGSLIIPAIALLIA